MTSKPENPTIVAYDQYAEIYDQEVIEFWDNFPIEFIDKFVATLPGLRILNLGSGSGRDALLLRDRGLEVVCADGSQAMVGMTRKLGFESHLITFADMNFTDASFDGVWAYTSLIHVPKSEADVTIDRISRMLKRGGAFAIGVIEGETAGMVTRSSMPDASRYFKNYTTPELRQMIEGHGLAFQYACDYRPHKNTYINQLYLKSE